MIEDKNKVTFVLTCCKRFDLLETTLKSFLKYNTYPIEEYIIIEDSPDVDKLKAVLEKFKDINFTVLYNNPQIGQLPSIDRAYAHVKTDYIFHCEDDWQFYGSGFIEKSFSILHDNEKVINVWIREQDDTNNHPVEPTVYTTGDGVEYKFMANGFNNLWHGFTFNPGLRRTKDYDLIKPYTKWVGESVINKEYHQLGFRGAILLNGYVKHIGNHRKIRFNINEKEWMKDYAVLKKRIGATLCRMIGI